MLINLVSLSLVKSLSRVGMTPSGAVGVTPTASTTRQTRHHVTISLHNTLRSGDTTTFNSDVNLVVILEHVSRSRDAHRRQHADEVLFDVLDCCKRDWNTMREWSMYPINSQVEIPTIYALLITRYLNRYQKQSTCCKLQDTLKYQLLFSLVN